MNSARKGKGLVSLAGAGVQLFSMQLLGLLFFFLLSVKMSVSDFGEMSWASMVAATIVLLLSAGLEQVVIRRVSATGLGWPAAAYFLHTVAFSIAVLLAMLLVQALLPAGGTKARLLPYFFCAQAIAGAVIPLRQYLNSTGRFGPYAILSFCTNAGRLVLAWWLAKNGGLTIPRIVGIVAGTAAVELAIISIYLAGKTDFSLRVRLSAYKKLLREASPQFLSVVFDAGLARADIILLGLMSTGIVTAHYSFAYRAFEVSRLPIGIIGAVLLPVFSAAFTTKGKNNIGPGAAQPGIQTLFRIEAVISCFIALGLIVFWAPLMDLATDGKYGTSNETVMIILAACIPLHFYINLGWTYAFAHRSYKPVLRITIIISTVNVCANLLAIPLLGQTGAALAFAFATGLQAILYHFHSRELGLRLNYTPALICIAGTLGICLGARLWPAPPFMKGITALLLFVACIILLKGLRRSDARELRNLRR